MSSILRTRNSTTPKVALIAVARSECGFTVGRLLLEDVVVLDDGVEEGEAVVGVRRDIVLLWDALEKLDTDGSRLVFTL